MASLSEEERELGPWEYSGIAHFADIADLSEYVAPASQRQTENPLEIA